MVLRKIVHTTTFWPRAARSSHSSRTFRSFCESPSATTAESSLPRQRGQAQNGTPSLREFACLNPVCLIENKVRRYLAKQEGEGISLHRVCHEAIYLDRSYNAAHYLQSIDRIHRLGLPQGTETRITILQSVAPHQVGSIDHSVSRRLLTKIRAMESVLDDADIRQLALDEEDAEPPVDRDTTLDDLADLFEQLTAPTVPGEEDQV